MSGQVKKRSQFKFGPYVPILRMSEKVIVDPEGIVDYYRERDPLANKLLGEILPDDSIVDAPSMVVPLLLKKKTIWPAKSEVANEQYNSANEEITPIAADGEDDDDDIQLIKIVNQSKKPKCDAQSERREYVKDYISKSVVNKFTANFETTLAVPDYHRTSASDLLFNIGLGQVQEFVLEDQHKRLNSKLHKGATHLLPEIDSVKSKLAEMKRFNQYYKLRPTFRCQHCQFKSESKANLDKHLENPHKINKRTFICNWCSFRTKDSNQITYHTYVVHNKRSKIEKPIPIHCCRFCDFESNSAVRYTKHTIKCSPNFDKDTVQAPDNPHDYAAVTPKLITQEDISTYELVLKDLRLAAYNPHQIEVNFHNSQNNVLLVTSSTIKLIQSTEPARNLSSLSSPYTSNLANLTPGLASQATSSVPNNLHQIAHALMATGANSNNMPNNRVTVLKHPKSNSVFTNGIFAVKNVENIVMAPSMINQNRSSSASDFESNSTTKRLRLSTFGPQTKNPVIVDLEPDEQDVSRRSKDSFVICEICDAYFEEFLKFKEHMIEVHQVKINSKTSATTRPPLNCQRCHWRFFTDQGLERHLLGSHGLVTTSMQDKAEKQMDSGRCTICGRKFAKRLVAHIKDAHKVNLKPAQLSYKCKVCSAIYGLYSHFEKHVQQIHSEL